MNNASFSAANAISFETYLAEHGSLTYSNVGRSMLPLLRQGKDLFTLQKKGDARCKTGDVVLYRRPPDRYVLHRVVEVLPESYVILGDNCLNREYGITDANILGVMTGFVRNGKEYRVSDFSYRLYSAFWMRTEKPRIFLKGMRRRLRRRR